MYNKLIILFIFTGFILNIQARELKHKDNSFVNQTSVNVSENDDEVIISNNNAKLIFQRGNFFDIKSIRLGDQVLLKKAGVNSIPWILTYKGPKGENPDLHPSEGIYKGYTIQKNQESATLVFRWDMRLSYDPILYPVRMSVTLADTTDLVMWNIEADLPKGWVIAKSQFPRITLQRPDNGKIITSASWGCEYDLKERMTYSENYPSHSGAMQLLLMHNTQGAFYYATEDRNACGKELKAVCGEKTVTFVTDVVTSEGWSNEKTGNFKLPWQTVMGFTNKGWQAAATQWYRPFTFTTEWGKKTLASRRIPQWLYDTDLWIRAKGVNDTVMNAVNKAIEYYGPGIGVHWYYWHHFPYDTHYPEYFPPKEHFTDMIREVKSKKGHVIPYINGRLWDPECDSYTNLNGKDASCRKADGTLYTEIYPTSKVLNTVTCPSSPIWQKIITDLVDKIQNDLKTNGVYIDQIAAAAPQPCWADNHDHPKGGGDFWYKAYRKMIENIRANHLKNNNILISEENSECYVDLFDILLVVNAQHHNCKVVPLFPIVYSDRVLTIAYTYTPTDRLTKGDFRYENAQCFLYGSQLGWVDPTLLMKEEAGTEAKFLKSLMQMRKKQHDIFHQGRYLRSIVPTGDNPTKEVPGFGTSAVVLASEWQSAKGEKFIFAVNMDDIEHKVVLPNQTSVNIQGMSVIRVRL